MNKTSILFVGTSDFAVYSLKAILSDGEFTLVGVITQPDKPSGRKQILEMPDVKKYLVENNINIPIFQPKRIRLEWEDILQQTNPEIIITASYGQILPDKMIKTPKYKSINIHASLLPLLRGAVPINMAILQDHSITGITFQLMSYKMDEGDILSQKETFVDESETTQTLTQKLGELSAQMLPEVIKSWCKGLIDPIAQDDSQATYCYKEDISKDKAEISINTDINTAGQMIRGFYPWPIAWLMIGDKGFEGKGFIQNKKLQIHKAILHKEETGMQGKIFKKNKTIFVGLRDGAIEIVLAKLEGKSLMSGKDYLFLAEK